MYFLYQITIEIKYTYTHILQIQVLYKYFLYQIMIEEKYTNIHMHMYPTYASSIHIYFYMYIKKLIMTEIKYTNISIHISYICKLHTCIFYIKF